MLGVTKLITLICLVLAFIQSCIVVNQFTNENFLEYDDKMVMGEVLISKPSYLSDKAVLIKGSYWGIEDNYWIDYLFTNFMRSEKENAHNLGVYNQNGKMINSINFRLGNPKKKAKFAKEKLIIKVDSSNYSFIEGLNGSVNIKVNGKQFSIVNSLTNYYSFNIDSVVKNSKINPNSTIIKKQGNQGNDSYFYWANYRGLLKGTDTHIRQFYSISGRLVNEGYFQMNNKTVITDDKYSFFSKSGISTPNYLQQDGVEYELRKVELKRYGSWVLTRFVSDKTNFRNQNYIMRNYSRLRLNLWSDSLLIADIPVCSSDLVKSWEADLNNVKEVLPSPAINRFFNTSEFKSKVHLISVDRELYDFEIMKDKNGKEFYFAIVTSAINSKREWLICKIEGTFVSFERNTLGIDSRFMM